MITQKEIERTQKIINNMVRDINNIDEDYIMWWFICQ